MFASISFQPAPLAHAVRAGRIHILSPLHPPRQNRLLAALPQVEYEHLLPNLESVPLPVGHSVHGAGDRQNFLYFITAGIVSRFYVTENGASSDIAITGNEGVIGIASFLGGDSTRSEAVVVSAGHAYRLRADLLQCEIEHHASLLRLLLAYTQALIAQTGQISVCNRHHRLRQQLCRWILSCVNRLPTDELFMTHDLIAQMLGVRREGVSEAAAHLQREGVIQCYRGHLAVLDRSRLEAAACECYGVISREYDRLLDPARVARMRAYPA